MSQDEISRGFVGRVRWVIGASSAGLHEPVLLSTGMATPGKVGQALEARGKTGLPRAKVTVLQCATNYSGPPDEANLRAMVAMHEQFSVDVGFSDHTNGIEASLAAVALGAKVIEKHLMLDKQLSGPDHFASVDPQEFRHMVDGIRKVERMLGFSLKAPTASEFDNRGIVRKSIFATAKIQAGDVFSAQEVGVKRPADGLLSMKWHDVIGAEAHRNFGSNDRIELG